MNATLREGRSALQEMRDSAQPAGTDCTADIPHTYLHLRKRDCMLKVSQEGPGPQRIARFCTTRGDRSYRRHATHILHAAVYSRRLSHVE
jgi:hypothetical protein